MANTATDGGSLSPALTDDGRFVVFDSSATNLVSGDTNGRRDIFLFDRTLDQTERISVATGGTESNGDSIAASVSADGRYVAFLSRATNLVIGDTNSVGDVFVRDRQAGTTDRVNLGPGNVQATGISQSWGSAAGSWPDSSLIAMGIFGYTQRVADNTETAISADGQVIVFVSDATNLVPSDTNGLPDVFVRHRQTETTARVSVTNTGNQLLKTANGVQQSMRPRVSISGDGRFVAFETAYAAVPEDTNATADVYVHDLQTATVTRVSVATGGQQGNGYSGWPSISGDGRYVAFASDASTLTAGDTNNNRDIFLRDRQTGQTVRASLNVLSGFRDRALAPAISRDGRWVTYTRPLVKQVYLFDALTSVIQTVSRASATTIADGVSLGSAVSADGSVVAFASAATNLSAADGNNADDVYVSGRDLIFNGSFDEGEAYWQTFAIPGTGIVWDADGGALRFSRTGSQAVILQPTRATVPAGVPLETQFEIANTSSNRKRFSVLVHDNDFSDLSVCTFWLAANAPARTYTMRSHTTRAWINATLSIYAASDGGDGGYYVVDNVSMRQTPGVTASRTDCLDPTAPLPGSGESPTLLTNGDFSAGLASWSLFGAIVGQVTSGVFEFHRPLSALPAGVILQGVNQFLPSGTILSSTFDLGNSSTVRKRVTVLLHDGDFGDLSACTFWMEPGQPLGPYAMRSFSTKPWVRPTVSVYAATFGAESWMRLDNVTLRHSSATSITGTECLEPADDSSAASLSIPGGFVSVAVDPSISSRTPKSGIPPLESNTTLLLIDDHRETLIDLSDATSASLSFQSSLPVRAGTGYVQVASNGAGWQTIAVVRGSAQRTQARVNLDPYVGTVVAVRWLRVAPPGSTEAWQVSGLRIEIDRFPRGRSPR